MAIVRINSGDEEALAAATFGSPDRLARNSARAAQTGDEVRIAGGVYNIAQLPNVNQGLARHLPFFNPTNDGITFVAEGTVEIVNMINGAPNPIGQPLIGAQNRRVRWLGDFVLDEKRATPRQGAGLVTIHNTTLCDVEYSYEGMPVGDPRHWLDNHVSCFAEAATNVRLRVRARDVHGAPGFAVNAPAVMLYGCDNVELYEPDVEDSDAGIYAKGTATRGGVRYPNTRIRIIRPRMRRLASHAISWHSVWDSVLEGGYAEDCTMGMRFDHLEWADDHPRNITVRGMGFRNCSRDIWFDANRYGHYSNIRLEIPQGTRIEYEGNDAADGYATVVPALALTPELEQAWDAPTSTCLRSRATDWETEIGDALQPTFYPQVKAKRWANECNFSMRLLLPDFTPDELRCEQDRVIFRKGNIVARFALKPGGMSFDILLLAAPPRNYLDFSIQSKEVAIYPQLPLAANDRGTRPPIAEYSLAIYHASRRHGQYATGKVCHLWRPRAVDSSDPAQSVWGRWDIVDANTIRMTIPQAALDQAVYPVVIT